MSLLGLFPGQGSQTVGMGKSWYESSDEAKKIFTAADEILNFKISKLCFEGPIEELTLTENAQPAILIVSYISFMLSDLTISAAAGHSLGEYTALVASNALTFEDAVLLVNKRGKYMQAAVPVDSGAMVAVMGSDENQIQTLINDNPNCFVEIANINSPGQIVLAGGKVQIMEFSNILSKTGAKVIPLNVSAPFHCSLMKGAADALSVDLDNITFKDPSIPVYSNFTAQKIETGVAARQCLKDQVCGTVKWTEQMKNIVSQENIKSTVEFGPNSVLTKLMKRIDPNVSRFEVFDVDSLNLTNSKMN